MNEAHIDRVADYLIEFTERISPLFEKYKDIFNDRDPKMVFLDLYMAEMHIRQQIPFNQSVFDYEIKENPWPKSE